MGYLPGLPVAIRVAMIGKESENGPGHFGDFGFDLPDPSQPDIREDDLSSGKSRRIRILAYSRRWSALVAYGPVRSHLQGS
jgi:hypothetical protein